MRECEYCGRSIVHKNAQAHYCSDKCRNYARLRKLRDPLPTELIDRPRWVRRTASKIPLTTDGRPASSVDATTWSTYTAAKESQAGVGMGFVLGGGIACIDLDHVVTAGLIDPRAVALLREAAPFYVEFSPSGDGIHGWVRHGSPTGRNKYVMENGLAVEWYEHSRYMTITGHRIEL